MKHFKSPLITTFFLSALISSTQLQAAEVYKWVDEQGNTHYSDKKPTQATHQSMQVYSGGASKQQPDIYKQSAALDERQAQASSLEEETKRLELEKQQTAKQCDMVRENLKIISETSRIKVEENGEQRYLSAKEISSRKLEYQKLLKEHCV